MAMEFVSLRDQKFYFTFNIFIIFFLLVRAYLASIISMIYIGLICDFLIYINITHIHTH